MLGRTPAEVGHVAIEDATQPVGVVPAYGALRQIVHGEQVGRRYRQDRTIEDGGFRCPNLS
ncbi:hypothetical protein GCM10010207_39190 [Streptomyces atratus]|nr:hypothetical protein GCM10010207_39190 [Streptomyces atratus]